MFIKLFLVVADQPFQRFVINARGGQKWQGINRKMAPKTLIRDAPIIWEDWNLQSLSLVNSLVGEWGRDS